MEITIEWIMAEGTKRTDYHNRQHAIDKRGYVDVRDYQKKEQEGI